MLLSALAEPVRMRYWREDLAGNLTCNPYPSA